MQSNGKCNYEIKMRVQTAWYGWTRETDVICDRKLSAGIKSKLYKVLVRPAMIYELETIAVTKSQKAELEVAEMKMFRFSLYVKDKTKSKTR